MSYSYSFGFVRLIKLFPKYYFFITSTMLVIQHLSSNYNAATHVVWKMKLFFFWLLLSFTAAFKNHLGAVVCWTQKKASELGVPWQLKTIHK